MNETSRKNGVARNLGAGATEAVREALGKGPKRLDALCRTTGMPWRSVQNAVNQLIYMGGVVTIREPNRRVKYALFRDAPKPDPPRAEGEFAIAQPMTIGRGSRWFV